MTINELMTPFAKEFAIHIDKFLRPVVEAKQMDPQEYVAAVTFIGMQTAAAANHLFAAPFMNREQWRQFADALYDAAAKAAVAQRMPKH
jgi:hypothetical protein